jgi:hypothetical protein
MSLMCDCFLQLTGLYLAYSPSELAIHLMLKTGAPTSSVNILFASPDNLFEHFLYIVAPLSLYLLTISPRLSHAV